MPPAITRAEAFLLTLLFSLFSIAVNLTLDPDKASLHLIFFTDHKSVIYEHVVQNQPGKLKQFNPVPCVLGSKGFISGRYHWEVQIGSQVLVGTGGLS